MIKKKGKFLTFIFSLLPGAGEMYMGFYKQGLSIMSLFWLIVFFAAFLHIDAILFIMPIVWFYGFFHANGLASTSDEEFYQLEDKFIFDFDKEDIFLEKISSKKRRNIVGGFLIFVGAYNLLNKFSYTFSWSWLNRLRFNLPSFVFSVLLIVLGVYLINGKKKELDQDEVIVEDNIVKEDIVEEDIVKENIVDEKVVEEVIAEENEV